jgi:hypothetical protein
VNSKHSFLGLFPWLLAALAGVLYLPNLFQHGGFMDGLYYGNTAMNLAEGRGSFWKPALTETFESYMKGQLPFGFWVESLLYRITQGAFYTDRLYGLLWWMITVWAMHRLVSKLSGSFHAWLTVILFTITPVVFWTYGNNLLEIPLTGWTTLSVLVYVELENRMPTLFRLLLTAFFIVLALFSKTLTGVFPLAFPFWFALYRHGAGGAKQGVVHALALGFFVSAFVGMLFLFEAPKTFLNDYLSVQLGPSLSGRDAQSGHTLILRKLAQELPVGMGFCALGMLFGWWRWEGKSRRLFWLGLAMALSASLPVMVSPKQSGFYILAAYPWFGLAFASLFSEDTLNLSTVRILRWTFAVVFFLGSCFCLYSAGDYCRDRETITAVKVLGKEIGHSQVVGFDNCQHQEYSAINYLYRYGRISVLLNDNRPQYWLTPYGKSGPEGFWRVSSSQNVWAVYTHQTSSSGQ